MRERRSFWITMLTLAALVLLSACNSSEQAEKQAANPESKESKEIVYATAKDIVDMNPHLYAGSMPAQGIVYESLVESTQEGIAPLLAASWELSEDGKVYTFKLREDVVFHDGEPFNAEAVKQNLEAVLSNAAKHSWIGLTTRIESCNVIDEFTVELVLTEGYQPALNELAMTRPFVFISPKSFINGETKDGVKSYHGTGPYKLAEHKVDQYAVFEANEQYWNGAPAVKKITSKVLPAGETTFLALQKGEVNFVFTDDRGADSLDEEAMEALVASGKYQLERSEPMNTKMIAANSGKADSPVSELAVREAIWHAIDRETISSQIMNGAEGPAEALFSANVYAADLPLKKREYDLETSKSLLESAGWVMKEGEGVRTKNGKPLAMSVYFDINSSTQKIQAEYIQSTLKEIGMQLELVGEESSSIANRRGTGEYDLLFNQTWGLAYDPQSTIAAFALESSYLHTTKGMKDADVLYSKIEQARAAQEESEAKALYADILNMVHEEAVFIPLTHGSVTVLAPSDLTGLAFKQTQFELPFERMSFK
ncbi:staphylopine-dependent metal ABC transporter substrate-binding lipoprotein [Paenibacillus sp. JSM ZJ436]|uniref:staphylopine-dependent metal ABC transporter substrate-binding lipoprotein n=1 Tax=Paenibacillus sp. JSM ZJ436 TaxID=3376190 RepID=UPI0037A47A0C